MLVHLDVVPYFLLLYRVPLCVCPTLLMSFIVDGQLDYVKLELMLLCTFT